MKCLTGFMRKECERRSSSEVGIVDRVNGLGAMAWAVAPELFCAMEAVNSMALIKRQSQEIAKVH